MGEANKTVPVYGTIIWDYINDISSQMKIVPLRYNFLSAQGVSESSKIEKFKERYGEPMENDGDTKEENGERFRMSMEHGVVFEKMLRNLDHIIRAAKETGGDAVISMVCKYDSYLGVLTRQLFADRPEILNGSEKEFKVSDILSYADFDELKDVLIEKEIETLLRKNHVDQLHWLGTKLGVELKKFDLLPDFVEIMERRNLFVHSNGVISRQYISECKKYGVELGDDVSVGGKFYAYYDYVNKAYKVLFQVGIMLGFVLWYKIRPEEGSEMISNLSDVAYELIRDESYELSLDVIDFALSNKSWAKEINSAQQLVFRVNKALSFHLRGLQKECEKIADSLDLTAADLVYHLAKAVLKKDYQKAYQLMTQIGATKQMLVNYKTWPLFTLIRKEEGFKSKFKEIYGEEYECDNAKAADFEEIIKSALELVQNTKDVPKSDVGEQNVDYQGT